MKTPPRRALVGLLLLMPFGTGCADKPLPATVEGTLQMKGKPLDNCLVTFFPESPTDEGAALHSTALTDAKGTFILHSADQREGASLGRHRVTVQDMSVSTGVRRRDHGTIDMEEDDQPPPPVRRSRISKRYLSIESTPLRVEITPGHQTIELEVK